MVTDRLARNPFLISLSRMFDVPLAALFGSMPLDRQRSDVGEMHKIGRAIENRLRAMVAALAQFKIADDVIRWIAVLVVDVIARRNLAVRVFPYRAV